MKRYERFIVGAAAFAVLGAAISLWSQVSTQSTYAQLPSAGLGGRLLLPTDGASIFRDTGVALQAWGPLYYGGSGVPSAGWSWDDQNGSTITSGGGVEYLLGAADARPLHVRYRTAPATPYAIVCLLAKQWTVAAKDSRFGLAFRESSSGKLITLSFGKTTVDTPYVAISKWTDSTTWSADYYFNGSANWNWTVSYPQHSWLKIANDGANLSFYYAHDGINWTQIDVSRAKGDFMGASGPDGVGFFAGSNSAATNAGASVLIWRSDAS